MFRTQGLYLCTVSMFPFASLQAANFGKIRGLDISRQHCPNILPPTSTPHRMNAASMFSRSAFSVGHIRPPQIACASNTPTGRLPDPPPAPQPSPLASLRRPPEVLPVHRSPHSDRQGRRLCARGAVHEGNARDAAVWLLARRNPDSRPPGRQPAKVHCVQRARG
jgi:hypothetical protein